MDPVPAPMSQRPVTPSCLSKSRTTSKRWSNQNPWPPSSPRTSKPASGYEMSVPSEARQIRTPVSSAGGGSQPWLMGLSRLPVMRSTLLVLVRVKSMDTWPSRRGFSSDAASAQVDGEVGSGRGSDVVLGDSVGELTQHQAVVGDIHDTQVGDDALDDPLAGQGQRALLNDLVGAVPGDVLHQDDDLLGAVDQVHRAAHALDHLARDHPVGDVAVCGDLHRTQDGGVDLATADHAEAGGRVEEGGTLAQGDGLLAGVDQVRILFPINGIGPDTQDAVLGLQNQLDVLGDILRHQRWQADPEVDVVTIGELGGGAGGHLLTIKGHQWWPPFSASGLGWTVRRSMRLSAACSAVSGRTRWT